MCTLNGERWLESQLASFVSQRHRNWTLYVSDDGSTDRTVELIVAFAARLGHTRVRLRRGSGAGSAANFLALACDASIDADYFALADQDDVWLCDRLARSIERIREHPAGRPVLYCGRTRYIDADGRALGRSPLFGRSPDFRNALVQSLAGGNTMTFNRAAHALIVRAGVQRVVVHDWWLYQLVAGCGGTVVYDPEALVEYRQHGANQIGSAHGWAARLSRLRAMLRGRVAHWNDVNDRALQQVEHLLTPDSRSALAAFRRARRGGLPTRLRALADSGVWRQTVAGTLGLWAGALAKRL